LDSPIEGLKIFRRIPTEDSRGSFMRLFCAEELAAIGLKKPIKQINLSTTHNIGTVRGLHFQTEPYSETKIVMCLKGRVFDVAVDLRPLSPTFLKWHAIELSPQNQRAFYIPEGFAHGFQTLESKCELLYLHTEFYTPKSEGGINCKDSTLKISWPKSITDISERDSALPSIDQVFEGRSL
jgi:dTDP-4-dehydrorhamnose 3,5-epimerase